MLSAVNTGGGWGLLLLLLVSLAAKPGLKSAVLLLLLAAMQQLYPCTTTEGSWCCLCCAGASTRLSSGLQPSAVSYTQAISHNVSCGCTGTSETRGRAGTPVGSPNLGPDADHGQGETRAQTLDTCSCNTYISTHQGDALKCAVVVISMS